MSKQWCNECFLILQDILRLTNISPTYYNIENFPSPPVEEQFPCSETGLLLLIVGFVRFLSFSFSWGSLNLLPLTFFVVVEIFNFNFIKTWKKFQTYRKVLSTGPTVFCILKFWKVSCKHSASSSSNTWTLSYISTICALTPEN